MDSIRAVEARRHQRASELFLVCVDLKAGERRQFLDERCAGDEDLRNEVESLLVQAARAKGFLETPPDLSLLDGGESPSAPIEGQRLAGYRVRRVLGWGSMGVVYLAAQDSPPRDVALKVLRAEALSPPLRRRFQRETEMLARLNHPAIARIYASGIEGDAQGGRPWFAMEYVAGRPLLDHCAAERLSVRARLRLFAEICEGVHSAHEQGIVHRDLKPSNLLVDRDGHPRILDFGVARLAGAAESSAFLTTAGQLVGTLAYMSPEQAAGDGRAVDRRSDVYSLGVLLFELLTGELPHSTRGLEIPEAVRMIREDEPVMLRTLVRELDLDLETIVSTALSKEPQRRYATARELALDVKRWLTNEPIQARPPSLVYQVSKLAKRHRALVAGTLTAIVALVVALAVSLLALDRARVAEAAAIAEWSESIRLSDIRGLRLLEDRVDALWPASSESVRDLEEWLATAEDIAGRAEAHRAWIAGTLARPELGAARCDLALDLGRALDRFLAPDAGALAVVTRRLESARTLRARSIEAQAAAWSEAVAAISDRRRFPAYAGLELAPQEGLVPLGPDPDSGLWEFGALDDSGRLQTRDGNSRLSDPGPDDGVTLVLLPAGEFWMGCQAVSPDLPNFDPQSRPHEGPPRRVRLEAFFLAKYETTQGQYRRVMGDNPSLWEVGDRPTYVGVTPRHPVEFLDWFMARRFAERLDMTLPTEAQWEYAARAGSSTIYLTGDDASGLLCRENLPAWFANGQRTRYGDLLAKPDGFEEHSPVGHFASNGFGLYDMIGNVSEWCLDPYKVSYHDLPLRAGDGLVLARSPDRDRSVRGCSFGSEALLARAGARTDAREEARAVYLGVRLARPLR
jgi:serine/threonine protein kinase/formylglycine-generating enzyme required for sulfatase activity